MHLFFTPDINSNKYTLNEEESKHAVRVLRLKVEDKVILIDGKGGWYTAVISNDNPKNCTVTITQQKKDFGKRNTYLHIAIAPTKNMDRLEWFIEKACEIGIDEVSLIDCSHNERTVVKTERLNKVAIAAIKQSLKAYLPIINEVLTFNKFIALNTNFKGEKYIAHCNAPLNPKKGETKIQLKNIYRQGSNALILIGPEGDFSIEEVKLAMENGFEEISLGSSRLRTETAALYACATVNILNE